VALGLCAQIAWAQEPAPTTESYSVPAPTLQTRYIKRAPELNVYGNAAYEAARAFIDWAAASPVNQREEARKMIWAARDNKDVAIALCKEAFQSIQVDNSRALVIIAILGELRNRAGAYCLAEMVQLPWPEKGTEVDGEIVEQTALGMLQAKAVEGLAYLQLPEGDSEVLRAIASHPSRIVRAAGINAYLWNHGDDNPRARALLGKYVRQGEEIFLDRPRREPQEAGREFNRRLEAYLKLHPEVIPPVPETGKPDEHERPYDQQPPQR